MKINWNNNFLRTALIFAALAGILGSVYLFFYYPDLYCKKLRDSKARTEAEWAQKLRYDPQFDALGKKWEQCCKPLAPAPETVTLDNFNFSNYGLTKAWDTWPDRGHEEILQQTLRKLLPLGTSKEDVENLLIVKGGAVPEPESIHTSYRHAAVAFSLNDYFYRTCKFSWYVMVVYSSEQKLDSLKVGGGGCGAINY